ncbi:siderochrome-iron transporter MirC [Nemania sp. FL0031]|nr:siderochrome-iron transporter MirC [Nemania sp. FL0031]
MVDPASTSNSRGRESNSAEIDTQDGDKATEATSTVWSNCRLSVAYSSIFLMAIATSLESQVTYSVVAFATSSFSSHSLIATVYVVQGVVNAVFNSPTAKIANVFGHLDAYVFCFVLYILGYIQMAASANVQTFASAQILYSAGSTGLQILHQIVIAETSSTRNRALLSMLTDVPVLGTAWFGPMLGNWFIANNTWRWAYGIWVIILPVAFIPLAITLYLNSRRARRLGSQQQRPARRSFAERTPGGWHSATVIALLVVGGVLLFVFPWWESWKKVAPQPLIPLKLFKSRTFCAGCAIAFFYNLVFYISVQPYFYSYLLVVQHQSIQSAGYITQTFTFAATLTALLVSALIKYTARYKYLVIAGSAIYLTAVALMIPYRTEHSTVKALVGTQVALGIGGGMLNAPVQLAMQVSAAAEDRRQKQKNQVAAAIAVSFTSLELGGAVGAALSGAVWTQLVPARLARHLPADVAGRARTIFGDVAIAGNYTLYPPASPARVAINRSYQETMRILVVIAVALCAPLYKRLNNNLLLSRMYMQL